MSESFISTVIDNMSDENLEKSLYACRSMWKESLDKQRSEGKPNEVMEKLLYEAIMKYKDDPVMNKCSCRYSHKLDNGMTCTRCGEAREEYK